MPKLLARNPMVFNDTAMNLKLIKVVTGMYANHPVNGTLPITKYFHPWMMIPQTGYITGNICI